MWVLRAGKPEPIPVRAGATDGAVTEIVSGDVAPGTGTEILDLEGVLSAAVG